MKTMWAITARAAALLAVMTLLCGVLYPLAVTGIAQAAFGDKAQGSIITVEGQPYGSALLAQPFTGDQYLWGRPMLVNTESFMGEDGEPLMYAGASNKTPAGHELSGVIAQRVETIRAAHREMGDAAIPVDLVTVSGSSLDPHISVAAAEYQIQRIAKNRGMDATAVREIVLKYTDKKWMGILGSETVNVLKVNLALDGLLV